MQLSRLSTDYIRHLAMSRGASPRTCESYDLAYRQYLHHTQELGLQDSVKNFTPETLQSWVEAMLAAGAKRSSVGMKLAALASLGKWAKTRKDERGKYVLDENPVERIERPRKNKPARTFLTADEVRSILSVQCQPCERLALRVLVETQARVSEVANAKVSDLQLDGDRVAMRVKRKGGEYDLVRLSPETSATLLDTLKQREAGADEPVLVNTAGGAYSRTNLSDMVARLARRAGVTRVSFVGAHLFARHTPASLAAQAGASVPEIAAMLGHADLSTARHYVHGVAADAARDRVRALWAPA
jgi:site-specific recombinase XerD